MSTPEEILLFFKRMKTRDILWLLFNAKVDNVAEWIQEKSYSLHKWGARHSKSRRNQ